jgi:poly(A) polymerase
MLDPTTPSSKQPCLRDDALAVLKRLREAGHIAYFAGGCVRDELLGIAPKDYDIATDAPPTRVRELFRSTQAVGAAFGVILVRHGKSVVEVATFRSDGAYLDGRRPSEVRFTTAEEDAKRRDFTINGLFLDPIDNRVIDYVGGQEDLKSRVLRAIGDPNHRFEEDHLRMLRAVRFAARFGLRIEPETSDAIRAHAQQLKAISPERIAEELRMMLTAPTRTQAWKLLEDYSLDDVVFRFLKLPWERVHPDLAGPRAHVLFQRVAPGESISFGLALSAAVLEYAARRLPHLAEWPRLMNQVTVRQMARAMRQALRISNDESDTLEGTLYGVEMLLREPMPSVAAMKRFLARATSAYSRVLLGALPAGVADEHRRQIEEALQTLEQSDYAPTPLLSGDDLVAAGWSPGPVFKRVLDQVYDAQLEDRIMTRQQALELANQLKQTIGADITRAKRPHPASPGVPGEEDTT